MSKRSDDFSNIFSENTAEHIPARTESGGLRCAVFTEPCKTSVELEALAKARAAEDHEVEFVEADDSPHVEPLIEPPTDEEICQLREHFTDDEWCILMGGQS
jgi:hypothetical protein